MEKKGNFFVRLLQSRIFFGVLFVLAIISFMRLGNEIVRRSKISAEIKHLHERTLALRSERDRLSALLSYLNSDQYIEEQARTQLNMRKPGETVVVITPTTPSSTAQLVTASKPTLWWDYFFADAH